jgi:carboxylesterase type B
LVLIIFSSFLPDDPEKLITLGKFNNVPLIAGLTESEGGLFGASKKNLWAEIISKFSSARLEFDFSFKLWQHFLDSI